MTTPAKKTANMTTPANKTATDPAYPGYLSGKGTLAFFDPLSQEAGSKWGSHSVSDSGSCQFTGGAYHASEQLKTKFASCRTNMIFSKFAFEVQLTIIQGECGGVTFREDSIKHFYFFRVCKDGTYKVSKYISSKGSDAETLLWSSSSVIHTGLGQQNKIAVVSNGSIIVISPLKWLGLT